MSDSETLATEQVFKGKVFAINRDIEAQTFALRDARDMVRRGEIVDMKTLVGLSLIG